MKRRFLLLPMGAALIVCAIAVAGTDSDGTGSNAELRQLRAKISALESRVATLEKKLQQSAPSVQPPLLRVEPPAIAPPRQPIIPQPGLFGQPLPGEGQRPKIWGEREINGWKYYIIPCRDGSATATEIQQPKSISPK